MTGRHPHDQALRDELIRALRSVQLPSGIGSRVPYGVLADAVLQQVGQFDVILHDTGEHLYNSTHCRHGDLELCVDDSGGRRPSQCKACGAPCRHTYDEGTPSG